MIDVGECLSPLSRFLRDYPGWAVCGGIAAVLLVFVIIKVFFLWNYGSGSYWTACAVVFTAITSLVLFFIGLMVWEWNAQAEEQRMYELMNECYGIEQLECSDGTCTWLKDGQPAAGTLVQRGDMAGLLDSNQTPLPLVNDEATR